MAAPCLTGCASSGHYLRLDPSLERDVRIFETSEYLPLVKICGHYNLKYTWDPFLKTAAIEKDNHSIALRAGSDRILVDGNEARLTRPVMLNSGDVYVPVTFVRNNLKAIVTVEPVESFEEPRRAEISGKAAIKTIVIDAGHGGKDVGAIGRKIRLREKKMTLAISKNLKKILEGQGFRVIMTRGDDTFVPLSRRVQIANKNNADLFVSIHINASRTKTLTGFECYFLSNTADDVGRAVTASESAPPKVESGTVLRRTKALDRTLWDMVLSENRAQSADLARQICTSVDEILPIKNRGVRAARFYVLKLTRMPAVLVEMGYISNRYEEMKLKDTTFVEKLTNAVADGILAYKREYERTDGYTSI